MPATTPSPEARAARSGRLREVDQAPDRRLRRPARHGADQRRCPLQRPVHAQRRPRRLLAGREEDIGLRQPAIPGEAVRPQRVGVLLPAPLGVMERVADRAEPRPEILVDAAPRAEEFLHEAAGGGQAPVARRPPRHGLAPQAELLGPVGVVAQEMDEQVVGPAAAGPVVDGLGRQGRGRQFRHPLVKIIVRRRLVQDVHRQALVGRIENVAGQRVGRALVVPRRRVVDRSRQEHLVKMRAFVQEDVPLVVLERAAGVRVGAAVVLEGDAPAAEVPLQAVRLQGIAEALARSRRSRPPSASPRCPAPRGRRTPRSAGTPAPAAPGTRAPSPPGNRSSGPSAG